MLGGHFSRFSAARWSAVTAAVATAGWLASALLSSARGSDGGTGPSEAAVVLASVPLGAVFGVLLGAAQGLLLRRWVRRPRLWIVGNAVAWGPAMAVILVGAGIPGERWPWPALLVLGGATGLTAGALVGAVTGAAASWMDSGLPRHPGNRLANPFVAGVLRSRLHGLFSRSLVLLTVAGRRSGRHITFPVAYAAEGDRLYVMAGQPKTKTWWRNLQGAGRL